MKKENGIKRLNRLSVRAKEYRDENTQVIKLSQAIEVIELLDEPKPLTEDQAWKVIADVYNQDGDRWREAKDQYLNSLKEKEAPVVPQFVADWFEENKDNLDNTIFYYCRDLHDTVKEDLEKFDEWFMESSDSIETLIKMKNGYEVEKEKLYHVIEPNTKQFLGYDRVTKESFWLLPQNSGALATLTEQEIKAINEAYWEYAMEVK